MSFSGIPVPVKPSPGFTVAGSTGGPNCTGGLGTSPGALKTGFLGHPAVGSWFSSTGFNTSLGYGNFSTH